MTNGRQALTVTAAAAYAGVSRRTIWNWLRLGKVESVHTASGRVRIYADTVLVPAARR